jgi:two-component system response regulator ChvI
LRWRFDGAVRGQRTPDSAIGRCRGGLSTKTDAAVDQAAMPIAVVLSQGQAFDRTMAQVLIVQLAPSRDLIIDRGYDGRGHTARCDNSVTMTIGVMSITRSHRISLLLQNRWDLMRDAERRTTIEGALADDDCDVKCAALSRGQVAGVRPVACRASPYRGLNRHEIRAGSDVRSEAEQRLYQNLFLHIPWQAFARMMSLAMATTEQIVNPATARPALLAANRSAPAIRILLIENDLTYQRLLTDKLSAQGFAVLSLDDGASLLGTLDNVGYADVILANWNLPGVSVVDLLAELRNRGMRIPVFFLAGNLSKSEKRLALEEGARGFIDKSHDIDGLIGRLKVLTRMFRRQQADKTISFGKLLLHMDISRAYWNQSDLCLSLGEYKTVELLASNAGHYVTYRAVYDRMHYEGFMAGDGEDGYRANVRSAIKRIRNKFRALDPTFDRIENYSGFGYRWKKPD